MCSQRETVTQRFAAEAERDPTQLANLVNELSPDALNKLRLATIAKLPTERVHSLFRRLDANKDATISLPEFEQWVASARREVEGLGVASVAAPTRRQLFHVGLRSCVPFIGFGFLDNAIMLVAGDAIDSTLGTALGISVLAAAGLGNLVSDVAGLGLSGAIERFASRLGLPDPRLSFQQTRLPAVARVTTAGSVLGIAIGCLLGMLPLLFMGGPETDEARSATKLVNSPEFIAGAAAAFTRIDKDQNEALDVAELQAAMSSVCSDLRRTFGVMPPPPTEAETRVLLQRFDKDGSGTLDRSEFLALAQQFFMESRVKL